MITTIGKQKTSRSGPGQSLTLIWYSCVSPEINWIKAIYSWVTISLTTTRWASIGIYLLVVALRCGWSKIRRLWIYLSAANICVRKYHKKEQIRNLWEYKLPWWFKIKHNKNNRFVVDQFTILENKHTHVHLTIHKIRKILINHCRNNDCRILKRNKQAPSCSSNC